MLLYGSENKEQSLHFTPLTVCFFVTEDCVYCSVRAASLTTI